MNRTIIATVFALTSAAAIAQTAPPPSAPTTPPAAPATPAPGTAAPARPTVAPSPTEMTPPTWSEAQAASEFRASKLIGMAVYNTKDERIGDVNDLIVSDSGSVTHAVIGVGGFLGMGEKRVAVNMKSLKVNRDKDGNVRVWLDSTTDQLKAAPDYKYM
jgi:sporulation protein YlmC with PRC-barrel domain